MGRPPQSKIALSRRDRTNWGLGRPPQSKIALSRRDRTILGFGQATTKQNRLILRRKGDFGVWAGHHKAKSPYLAEIGRFCGLGRPPQSKIALSRRDRTILGFGQATTKQNRLISPRTILGLGQATTRQNRLISPR